MLLTVDGTGSNCEYACQATDPSTVRTARLMTERNRLPDPEFDLRTYCTHRLRQRLFYGAVWSSVMKFVTISWAGGDLEYEMSGL